MHEGINMIIREAEIKDIQAMHQVRVSVNENVLSDPSRITEKDYVEYLDSRGKGWVCEMNGRLVGFAIVDVVDNNIWALFVDPQFEQKGIGKKLHDTMLAWYFRQTDETVWLGTAPGTRAERFYQKMGWNKTGSYGKDEVKFEMTKAAWLRNNSENSQ